MRLEAHAFRHAARPRGKPLSPPDPQPSFAERRADNLMRHRAVRLPPVVGFAPLRFGIANKNPMRREAMRLLPAVGFAGLRLENVDKNPMRREKYSFFVPNSREKRRACNRIHNDNRAENLLCPANGQSRSVVEFTRRRSGFANQDPMRRENTAPFHSCPGSAMLKAPSKKDHTHETNRLRHRARHDGQRCGKTSNR
jgi:hypothetical protein